MIKIKDYIFNENEITHIVQNSNENLDTDYLIVYGKDKNEHKFITINATFEDIEWNYGNNISESLSYDLAKARIEELEEENKKLKETNKNLIFLKDNYSKSINEASRFIVKNAIVSDKWEEIEPLEFIPIGNITYKSLSKNKVQELDKILKGEENE